nr:hypothetical protein [Bacilli bacterium]
ITLAQEINKLNVYDIEAIFLTSNDFIAYTRNLIYCYADVIDTSGKLITSILLSGESETDHIENSQRIVLTAKFNMLKTSADRYAGVIFTSSLG